MGGSKSSGNFSKQVGDDLTSDRVWYTRAYCACRGNIWLKEANVAGAGDAQIANVRAGMVTQLTKFDAFVAEVFDDDSMAGGIPRADLVGIFCFSNWVVVALA